MLRNYQQAAVDAALNFYKYRAPRHGYVTAPGGSGKSHMIAALGELLYDMGRRVLVLARSEKLLSQNRSKFATTYHEHIGIYCAGLESWDASKPITIASVQSMAGLVNPPQFDVALCDEVDEIPADESSQYQRLLSATGNPRVIGFTATPFRTGSGNIDWGDEIINIPIAAIMAAGHLTPPTNKVGATLDLSGIKVTLGEYVASQLDEVYADPELLALSVEKIKQYSAERSSVLVFCQSIKHMDLLAAAMEQNGMPCVSVTGETDKEELGFILEDFEAGRIKYLLNVALLVRGYDMPCVDMIALLLSTKSKRKFEQMLYRGTRLKEGKRDFLVLDMGNNFAEHGALGSPYKGKTTREASAPTGRICPVCETFAPLMAKDCPDCGYIFPEAEAPQVNHSREADAYSNPIYTGTIESYEVTGLSFKLRDSKSKNRMLVAEYHCGFGKYGTAAEFLLPWHSSDFVRGKVTQWFIKHQHQLGSDPNTYSEDDILWHAEQCKVPTSITIDHSEQFPRIVAVQFEPVERPPIEEELSDCIPY